MINNHLKNINVDKNTYNLAFKLLNCIQFDNKYLNVYDFEESIMIEYHCPKFVLSIQIIRGKYETLIYRGNKNVSFWLASKNLNKTNGFIKKHLFGKLK